MVSPRFMDDLEFHDFFIWEVPSLPLLGSFYTRLAYDLAISFLDYSPLEVVYLLVIGVEE